MPAKPRSAVSSRSADAERIVERLAQVFPGATTELHYRSPFELLVATILSAQSTDARVNSVTPALFDRYPDAASLAAAAESDVEDLIRPTGFFRAKTRAIVSAADALVERFAGEVPSRMAELVSLPGVGRKTANVVLGHAFGVPGLPVDRHVFRVVRRLGLAKGKTPEAVETTLCKLLPERLWTLASDCLILHGRRVCRPRPLCAKCAVSAHCDFFARSAARVSGAPKMAKARGAPPPAGARRRPPTRRGRQG